MATARGDRVAERVSQSDVATKASERYQRAQTELSSLPPARPTTELQAKIDGLLQTPGADGCNAINGKVTKAICPEVTELRAELARSQRRAELESTMRQTEGEIAHGSTVKADPGASALAAYLGLVGLKVEASLLSELLILVGVLALEVGSALSLVMVQAVSVSRAAVRAEGVNEQAQEAPQNEPVVQREPAENSGDVGGATTAREEVKTRILNQLKTTGKVSGSQRGLAKLIGADKTTMRRAINGLVLAVWSRWKPQGTVRYCDWWPRSLVGGLITRLAPCLQL